jgi:hypothetical protein
MAVQCPPLYFLLYLTLYQLLVPQRSHSSTLHITYTFCLAHDSFILRFSHLHSSRLNCLVYPGPLAEYKNPLVSGIYHIEDGPAFILDTYSPSCAVVCRPFAPPTHTSSSSDAGQGLL